MIDLSQLNTPGERIKYIRKNLLKLSRAALCKRYNLPVDTLAAWENGKFKISKKGVERCIKLFGAENVLVSHEWIIVGEGLAPNFSFELNRYFKSKATEKPKETLDDNVLLIQEIEYFLSSTTNTVTCMITGDEMLPVYVRGDHVGGRFRYENAIASCAGKDCIVKLQSEELLVRRVVQDAENSKLNLICLNMAWNETIEPVLYDVAIECAAPIIWHRRSDN